ncbi:tRNA (adenosine(37)-N6)-threonylcarbamoyltransferase complex transferase subunit TsaD [cyanobiont of Ornithocercus magnificus]|nr:tRNA (adenosine(37)-N6)-threonylcarbamoyltransferase complex transferase subunit TsaD [cyanobiont of Ornithocercus magnificus]
MNTVLALETSCDESAAAVVCRRKDGSINVLAHRIASQVKEHERWGGVVPEVASRLHVELLPDLIAGALKDAALPWPAIDAVAATVTPGLTGALMVASVTGRTLAMLHGKPFLGVHHLEGHLSSVYLAEGTARPETPYLALLVSGGHTEIIRVSQGGSTTCLGKSHDDAAGEAFDKAARLLGLGYPGGPAIQAAARTGDPSRFHFPRGRVSRPSGGFYPYDFSFSGLKTAVLRQVQNLQISTERLPVEDLAASFEQAVVEVLVERSIKCARDNQLDELVMVGGVAANHELRRQMADQGRRFFITTHVAPLNFCTDNAAMVGSAALERLASGQCSSSWTLGVSARWPLERTSALYEMTPPF